MGGEQLYQSSDKPSDYQGGAGPGFAQGVTTGVGDKRSNDSEKSKTENPVLHIKKFFTTNDRTIFKRTHGRGKKEDRGFSNEIAAKNWKGKARNGGNTKAKKLRKN